MNVKIVFVFVFNRIPDSCTKNPDGNDCTDERNYSAGEEI